MKVQTLTKSSELVKIDDEQIEEEEINIQNFYKLRRLFAIILNCIENLYEISNSMNFIAKYRRVCYDSENNMESTNSKFLDVTSKQIDTSRPRS